MPHEADRSASPNLWTSALCDLRPDLRPHIQRLHVGRDAFLFALSFIVQDTARDPRFRDTHFLGYLCEDFIQSVVAVALLATEGAINVCKRELRFLLEAALKLCFVQQRDYALPIDSKLTAFQAYLQDTSIGLRKSLQLGLLPAEAVSDFNLAVGRAYGRTSNYVHLTPVQIRERITASDAGRFSGMESAEDLEDLVDLADEVLALVLVYLFHASPSHVAGDFFVTAEGETIEWYFMASRFLAMIDAQFDYKHERQPVLAQVAERRQALLRF
jgi:hypothetical protein